MPRSADSGSVGLLEFTEQREKVERCVRRASLRLRRRILDQPVDPRLGLGLGLDFEHSIRCHITIGCRQVGIDDVRARKFRASLSYR